MIWKRNSCTTRPAIVSPLSRLQGCLFTAFLLVCLTPVVFPDDLQLRMPKPHAPMDPRKEPAPVTSLSKADAQELKGEFGGILYMAQKPFQLEKWPGKEMSDCRPGTSENVCSVCELIMGHSSAEYYFYKDASKKGCTLRQVDAHFQVSDANVLKYLRGTAQSLLGTAVRGVKPASKEAGWEGAGPGWTWDTDEDLAYLYMDTEQGGYDGQGIARFQWRRSPLFKASKQ